MTAREGGHSGWHRPDESNAVDAILHRIRTGMSTDRDADRVAAMLRAAHDWGWRNGVASRDESRGCETCRYRSYTKEGEQ